MAVPEAYEVNFDGLIGPTHNYAGLSRGNLASQRHAYRVSSPKQGALQGLAKMKVLAGLGVKQALLPPQDRPDLTLLRRLGFTGSDTLVIEAANREAPQLLAAAFSASSMWAANAATVSPSADTRDGRVHFTPANLPSTAHRGVEPGQTSAILKRIFSDPSRFVHHRPLPAGVCFRDEGAANHTRLCSGYGHPGVEVFVFGQEELNPEQPRPHTYGARQTLEASHAVARLHGLDLNRTLFVQQNPDAIDAGVFHNDVIAVGNRNVLLYHRDAFVCPGRGHDPVELIRRAYEQGCGGELIKIEIAGDELSLEQAVGSYLFNSQLVTLPGEMMALVCPTECRIHDASRAVLDRVLREKNPVEAIRFVDLRQSMQNGGGPACLRLRVVLTPDQISATHPGVLFTDELYAVLTQWVHKHYRGELTPQDLADPKLIDESCAALDELTTILELPLLYPFQK